jgi:succinylglutamate desuccinylase
MRESTVSAIVDESGPCLRAGGRIIASVRGEKAGPTLIVISSLHGNEPAGTFAAERLAASLQAKQSVLSGEVVMLIGNTRALKEGVRYIDADLNRHWTRANIEAAVKNVPNACSETVELREILDTLEAVFARARGDVYIIDLHTTSAAGAPFATLGDTLRNRHFALQFPVTILLGIEEQLDGTFLEYVNNLGVVTMGLEAGQHEAPSSVDNHEAVIWLATVAAGNLTREQMPDYDQHRETLHGAGGGARFVEVRYRYAISPAEEFRMDPGFKNFQAVRRGQVLAHDRKGDIDALESGLILMPLYQKLGDDGFFLGREVKPFWLKVSALLRRLRIGDYSYLLPGVKRDSRDADTFLVNTQIARLLPLQIFHLLGFRKRRWRSGQLVVSKRKYDLVGPKSFRLIDLRHI